MFLIKRRHLIVLNNQQSRGIQFCLKPQGEWNLKSYDELILKLSLGASLMQEYTIADYICLFISRHHVHSPRTYHDTLSDPT
jgi:hypothetical protein